MKKLFIVFLLTGCFVPIKEDLLLTFSEAFCPSNQLIRIRLENSQSKQDWENSKKWVKEKCAEVGVFKEVEDEDYEDILTELRKKYKNF